LDSLSRLFLNSMTAVRSGTLYATTQAGFTMPPADSVTESADVAVNTNSFITMGNLDGYVMDGVGVVRLKRGNAPNTIRVVNPGYAGNAAPASSITSGKAITSTTELNWVFDLPDLPTDYTLYKSTDGENYNAVATLSAGFSQPFKDEDPPSPDLYYRIIANMPANTQGIPFGYVLIYTPRSV